MSETMERRAENGGGGGVATENNHEAGAFSLPLIAKTTSQSDPEKKIPNGPNNEFCTSIDKTETDTHQTHQDEDDPDKIFCFNVGGKRYYCMRRNFDRFPDTKLGELVRCRLRSEKLKLCDRYIDGEIPEFFFDRSWKGFNDILDVYRLGRLHLNSSGLCAIRMKALIDYWQIDELLLDPCCALKYYPEIEACCKEIDGQLESERKYIERLSVEDFGSTPVGKVRKFLWNLTEYPETSLGARIFAFTSMSVVVISTVTFVLGTMPELTDNLDIMLFDNETETDGSLNSIQTTPVPITVQPPVERWEEGILALKIVDELTMWFFTLEYLVRFLCAPRRWLFFKAPLNLVDLLAILPYFVSFVMEELKDTLVIGRAGKVLRLVRVMRILRVFKLVRHFNGLQSLLSTLKQAYKELGLLMVLVSVCVLTFSSLIYFAEKEAKDKWSFMDSFWWGLMTLTTVGYGSRAPQSFAGQVIGGFCALIGVFILALPVPIVVNRFADFASNYKNRVWRNEVMMRKQERGIQEKKGTGIDLPLVNNRVIRGDDPEMENSIALINKQTV